MLPECLLVRCGCSAQCCQQRGELQKLRDSELKVLWRCGEVLLALPRRLSVASLRWSGSGENGHNLHKYLIASLFTRGFDYAPWDCTFSAFILFVRQSSPPPFLKPKQPEEATKQSCSCLSLLSCSAGLQVPSVGLGLSPRCSGDAAVGCCCVELSVGRRSDPRAVSFSPFGGAEAWSR